LFADLIKADIIPSLNVIVIPQATSNRMPIIRLFFPVLRTIRLHEFTPFGPKVVSALYDVSRIAIEPRVHGVSLCLVDGVHRPAAFLLYFFETEGVDQEPIAEHPESNANNPNTAYGYEFDPWGFHVDQEDFGANAPIETSCGYGCQRGTPQEICTGIQAVGSVEASLVIPQMHEPLKTEA